MDPVIDNKVGQTAEGKIFNFLPESEILTNELKTFEFNSEDQVIVTETNEFSAVCPFSGLPDIAKLKITYKPKGRKCIELKSLKYYIVSFRPVGIYQEAVTKRIYDDLKKVLETDSIEIITIYNTRGGFDTTCIEGKL